jgi:L-ascorbate metabolism protein UlaG (beta-lactamase superfamily)
MNDVRLRYLDGPTHLIEYAGLRLLVDPTFDRAGDHPVGTRVLTKTGDAVAGPAEIGPVDAVLLSHDQHPDNLDVGGRAYVASAPLVLSTPAAEGRLGGAVRGLAPWDVVELEGATITAVPALHGPEGTEPYVGEVTGFVLEAPGQPRVYVSGDNASLERVRRIADRFAPVDVAVLFAGAARTALADGAPLTLTSAWATEAARMLAARRVVPVHFEGWAHFSEGRATLAPAFAAAGLADRLVLLERGEWWSYQPLSNSGMH